MFFTPRAIEDDIADWVEDRFAILLEQLAHEQSVRETELALPNDLRFVAEAATKEKRAALIYQVVAQMCGFEGWPVTLTAMGDEGRVLVRASGNEPLLRVMVEASSQEQVDHWTDHLSELADQLLNV